MPSLPGENALGAPQIMIDQVYISRLRELLRTVLTRRLQIWSTSQLLHRERLAHIGPLFAWQRASASLPAFTGYVVPPWRLLVGT